MCVCVKGVLLCYLVIGQCTTEAIDHHAGKMSWQWRRRVFKNCAVELCLKTEEESFAMSLTLSEDMRQAASSEDPSELLRIHSN